MTVSNRPKPRHKILRRLAWVLCALITALLIAGTGGWWLSVRMPGESDHGELGELTSEQRELAAELRGHVTRLAGEIGERNSKHYPALQEAALYVEHVLSEPGYEVRRQTFRFEERDYHNLEAELLGTSKPEDLVIVGAHYDSAEGAPGANDNGSGAAALLALAKRFAGDPQGCTIRFVAFTNEEPPHFKKEAMGSLAYARSLREEERRVVAMLSLETMGYYSDAPGSQQYPSPLSAFYPDRGNFIAFVADVGSREHVHRAIESFRIHSNFPSEGGALPASLPGVGWSDHWAFWEQGYPGVMVTDTAPFRYPHYHEAEDTPDKVNYDRLARVVDGLRGVISDLAQ